MKLIPVCVVFFSLALHSGCSRKEVSAEELIAALEATGCNVVKEAKIHHSLEGALQAFWLRIDGRRVSAYQVSTTARANLKVRTFTDGLFIGCWVFEYVDSQTEGKLRRALE